MTRHDLAKAFLAKGLEDEVLVRKVCEDADVSDDIFGFHVQQALEKYIKAVLAADEIRPARSHDLGVLLDEVKTAGHEVPDEVAAAVEWTPHAVRTRYPFFAPRPPIDRAAALALVTRMRRWAEEIIA